MPNALLLFHRVSKNQKKGLLNFAGHEMRERVSVQRRVWLKTDAKAQPSPRADIGVVEGLEGDDELLEARDAPWRVGRNKKSPKWKTTTSF